LARSHDAARRRTGQPVGFTELGGELVTIRTGRPAHNVELAMIADMASQVVCASRSIAGGTPVLAMTRLADRHGHAGCISTQPVHASVTWRWRKALGEKEVADLLSQTLEEEKQTDLKLTEVTWTAIMPEALAGEEEEGGGGSSGSRRKAA
jgi:hypothetical protein